MKISAFFLILFVSVTLNAGAQSTPNDDSKVGVLNMTKDGAEQAEIVALATSTRGMTVVYNGKNGTLAKGVHDGLTRAAKEGFLIVGFIIAPGDETYSFYMYGKRLEPVSNQSATQNPDKNDLIVFRIVSELASKAD